MRSIWLSLLALIVCGGIGGVAGWSLAMFFGLSGLVAAMVALIPAMVIAAALWAAGVALLDKLRHR
jgi:high-affinity K+ transport system ATPase subunit B